MTTPRTMVVSTRVHLLFTSGARQLPTRLWELGSFLLIKLSQDFEAHEVGAKPMTLFSGIGLCCSDKMRWTAESSVVRRSRDDELIPGEHFVLTSVAWGSCDCNSKARYESTIHTCRQHCCDGALPANQSQCTCKPIGGRGMEKA